jgi:predicted RND superfamily exporter protein
LENQKTLTDKVNELNAIIVSLRNKLEVSSKENEHLLKQKEAEVEKKYLERITSLENQIEKIQLVKTNEINEIKNSHLVEIKDLNNKISNHNVELTYKLKEKEIEFNLLKEKQLNFIKEEYEGKLKEKDDMINMLQRQKSSLNVKQTGEDLESWCNNEVLSYMQNGLFNCIH